jgi:hypothetical protein
VGQHGDLKLASRGTSRTGRPKGARQRIEVRCGALLNGGFVSNGPALVTNRNDPLGEPVDRRW